MRNQEGEHEVGSVQQAAEAQIGLLAVWYYVIARHVAHAHTAYVWSERSIELRRGGGWRHIKEELECGFGNGRRIEAVRHTWTTNHSPIYLPCVQVLKCRRDFQVGFGENREMATSSLKPSSHFAAIWM